MLYTITNQTKSQFKFSAEEPNFSKMSYEQIRDINIANSEKRIAELVEAAGMPKGTTISEYNIVMAENKTAIDVKKAGLPEGATISQLNSFKEQARLDSLSRKSELQNLTSAEIKESELIKAVQRARGIIL